MNLLSKSVFLLIFRYPDTQLSFAYAIEIYSNGKRILNSDSMRQRVRIGAPKRAESVGLHIYLSFFSFEYFRPNPDLQNVSNFEKNILLTLVHL